MKLPTVPEELSKEIEANIPARAHSAVIHILKGIEMYGMRCFQTGGIGDDGQPRGACKNCGKTCRVCSAEQCTIRAYCQNPTKPLQSLCHEYYGGCDHKRLLNGRTICEDHDIHCRRKSQ